MVLNHVKLGRAITFMKYLASVVSLTFLSKTDDCIGFGETYRNGCK